MHIITTLELGGAEKQLLALANKQTELGHKVTIIFLKGTGSLMSKFKKASVIDLSRNRFSFQIVHCFTEIIRRDPDVLIAHLPRAEILTAIINCFHKFTLITVKHNSEPFWPGANRLLSQHLALFVEKRACMTIVISKSVGDFLKEKRELRDFDKLHTVYYGFESDITHLESQNFMSKESSGLKILTIARLVPQKNLPVLLKAIPSLIHLDPHLRIVGVGPEMESLRELAKELKIEKRIDFLGKVENVKGELVSCDVFVLPSRYEGFGLVLLEAMAAQRRIVASNIPVFHEVLGRKYRFLFDNESPLDLAEKIEQAIKFDYKDIVEFSSSRLKVFELTRQAVQLDELSLNCLRKRNQ
jgi:glycosyltransferase involved in cell wall biosynthesis